MRTVNCPVASLIRIHSCELEVESAGHIARGRVAEHVVVVEVAVDDLDMARGGLGVRLRRLRRCQRVQLGGRE